MHITKVRCLLRPNTKDYGSTSNNISKNHTPNMRTLHCFLL